MRIALIIVSLWLALGLGGACSSGSSGAAATGDGDDTDRVGHDATGDGDDTDRVGHDATADAQASELSDVDAIEPGPDVTPALGSCKRGIAYGHHSLADLSALQPAVRWWYNWAYTPDPGLVDGGYRTLGVEYAPMIWGGTFDTKTATDEIPQGAKVLLGFNEPNFGSQSNLSATEAAALWPDLEAIADARGLLLVSPAVNYCGGDCQDTDPFHYLDEFFEACAGCRVDRVAFHVYVGCHPSGSNKAQWLIDHVETYKQRFSQPLWLTELACTDAKNFDEQIAFLEDAVAYLESDPRIERYAWFSGRFQGIPFVDLLGDDGTLTPLGQAYVSAPSPSCKP
ncbi:MAG: glycoside hydrolase family protein [Myxococcales bacterium]|nr:glycoside hydrolase family protein [Myxococcales bacterium]